MEDFPRLLRHFGPSPTSVNNWNRFHARCNGRVISLQRCVGNPDTFPGAIDQAMTDLQDPIDRGRPITGGVTGDSVPVPRLSLIHISEPTRRTPISYAVFCLKK